MENELGNKIEEEQGNKQNGNGAGLHIRDGNEHNNILMDKGTVLFFILYALTLIYIFLVVSDSWKS